MSYHDSVQTLLPAMFVERDFDLTIKLNEQQIFHKRYSVEETREKVLEDLDPYTNYTFILIAVNNALNKSSAEQIVIIFI
ncbi:hypothetical protein EB796_004070 [Bugula neritina]|uniref:Uncharacterized protein n=1 Tax=Bugula neritina TaxID=10212 RepID=A0A7J7KH95_BUGNE|nr:hypothetical protein EB796_004070 [Bugula neritina]